MIYNINDPLSCRKRRSRPACWTWPRENSTNSASLPSTKPASEVRATPRRPLSPAPVSWLRSWTNRSSKIWWFAPANASLTTCRTRRHRNRRSAGTSTGRRSIRKTLASTWRHTSARSSSRSRSLCAPIRASTR